LAAAVGNDIATELPAKTLKVEAVYPMAFETFEEVTEHLFYFICDDLQQTQTTLSARLSEPAIVRGSTHPVDWQNTGLIIARPQGRTPGDRLHLSVIGGIAKQSVNCRGPLTIFVHCCS
jgi:hypothetical protein